MADSSAFHGGGAEREHEARRRRGRTSTIRKPGRGSRKSREAFVRFLCVLFLAVKRVVGTYEVHEEAYLDWHQCITFELYFA